jgi:hypothetical protein
MSCCGKQRTSTTNASNAAGLQRRAATSPAPLVLFEYCGGTALTAVGPVTGRRYRFERPQARVAVDGRDAASLAAVPHLRPVKGA